MFLQCCKALEILSQDTAHLGVHYTFNLHEFIQIRKLLVSDPSYQLPSSASQIYLDKKQLPISSKKTLQWDIPAAEITLALSPTSSKGSNPCQILSHVEEQKSWGQKSFPADSLQCRGRTGTAGLYLQRLFHSLSVVQVEHPPHTTCPGCQRVLCHSTERMLSDFRAVSVSW